MARHKRVARPPGELRREFDEQIGLLKRSCEYFDQGCEAAGKLISLNLRVLLHQHGQSRALMEQLGMRHGRFVDTAGPLNPRNLLPECNLVGMRLGPQTGKYLPKVLLGGPPLQARPRAFHLWWTDAVLKDNRGRTFSRLDLVRHVADTDGGAHVDPELDEAYMALSRGNSLGWHFGSGDVVKAFEGRPELACMRQIAHELLQTIDKRFNRR